MDRRQFLQLGSMAAGEHTSPWPGWIQGALHSGVRAAREVARGTA